jgi:hypothetical protein
MTDDARVVGCRDIVERLYKAFTTGDHSLIPSIEEVEAALGVPTDTVSNERSPARVAEAAWAVVNGWQDNMTVVEEYTPLVNTLRLALAPPSGINLPPVGTTVASASVNAASVPVVDVPADAEQLCRDLERFAIHHKAGGHAFTAQRLREAIAIIRGVEPKMDCPWSNQDEGGSWWSTGCGEEFISSSDGDEPPRWMKFCPYCGKVPTFDADDAPSAPKHDPGCATNRGVRMCDCTAFMESPPKVGDPK